MKSEIGGNYERLVLGLMMKPVDFDCYCLYKAMAGAGTDEAVSKLYLSLIQWIFCNRHSLFWKKNCN